MSKFEILKKSLEEKTGFKYPKCFGVWKHEGTTIIKKEIGEKEINPADLGICECSQQGLVIIHHFSYNGYEIDIGSNCVNKFKDEDDLSVKKLVNKCKEQEKKLKYNDCYFCNEKNICPPKSKYEIKQFACNNCYSKKLDKIKCAGKCGWYRPFEKTYDGKGFKKLCWKCFKNKKQ